MTPKDAWSAAYQQLELQLDRATFDTWVRGATLLNCELTHDGAEIFVIGVKNGYAREMLQQRLYRNIRRVLSDIYGKTVELRFEVRKASAATVTVDDEMPLFRLLAQQQEAPEAPPATVMEERSRPLHEQLARPVRPDLPESDLNPRYTFDRFVAGNENAMVYAAAKAVAERPAAAYNPFFIYGDVGLGKTHLMQAIAHECRAKGLHVVYIPSEAFTNDLIDSIRQRSTAMFRDKYRSADVLLVDDIQFIGGKDSTQEEFFHTFNRLKDFNKQIVLASDRHPRDLETLEARLRSRFEAGLVMDVQPPSLETRQAILKNWAYERGIRIDRGVLSMIAERARMNVRELEGIFNQMLATMQLSGELLDGETAENILNGYRKPRHHSLTVRQVIEVVARHFGLTPDELMGPRRNTRINEARQIAMYLARELTSASLPQIGEAFGGRKHSTVLHSCAMVQADLDQYDMTHAIIKELRRKLKGVIGDIDHDEA
jgi:chromosomal replication initiator protein